MKLCSLPVMGLREETKNAILPSLDIHTHTQLCGSHFQGDWLLIPIRSFPQPCQNKNVFASRRKIARTELPVLHGASCFTILAQPLTCHQQCFHPMWDTEKCLSSETMEQPKRCTKRPFPRYPPGSKLFRASR